MWVELRVPRRDAAAFRTALLGFARLGYRTKLSSTAVAHWIEAWVPDNRGALDRALVVLQGISELQLRRAANAGYFPTLYNAGVEYEREPPRREWWQTALDNFTVRVGDCEDLANHRAAELVVYTGEPARAVTVRTGPRAFHAVVRRADGTIEDPSAALGMLRGRRSA